MTDEMSGRAARAALLNHVLLRDVVTMATLVVWCPVPVSVVALARRRIPKAG